MPDCGERFRLRRSAALGAAGRLLEERRGSEREDVLA
jgi:hypothetical protein